MIKKIDTLYPVSIWLGYCTTEEEYESIFHDGDWKKTIEEYSTSDGLTVYCDHRLLIHYNEYFEFGTIMHECYHGANNIWNCIGAKHDTDNDEPFAYLLSFLTEESRKFLAERFSPEMGKDINNS